MARFATPEDEWRAYLDGTHPSIRLVAQAGPGEILVTDAAASAARLHVDALERRHLSLKGAQADVVVVPPAAPAVADGSASR